MGMIGKKHSEETKIKISRTMKGKYSGEKSSNWKGGITKTNITLYSTFAHQLEKYEECRKTEEGYLEVRCTYCGKWFMPNRRIIYKRISAINGTTNGEYRFYCSKGCKQECPIYRQKPEWLIIRDKINVGIRQPNDLSREIQPDLRKLVLNRDNYECQICGSNESLHCHHYEGIEQNPIESADVDMCITLCKNCHLKAHQQPNCNFYDIRRKICYE